MFLQLPCSSLESGHELDTNFYDFNYDRIFIGGFLLQCRGRDLNPHALCRTQDFKSCASTNSATPAISMTNAECGIIKSQLIIHIPQFIEAPSGFEPLHKGFADLSLTTWVRRQFLSIFQILSGILLQPAKSYSGIKTPLPGGLYGSGASSLRRFLSFSIRHLGEMMPSSKDESVPDSVASQRQSGKRGSDPRPQPWQGCALPTELFPHNLCNIPKTIPLRKSFFARYTFFIRSLSRNHMVRVVLFHFCPEYQISV